MVFQQFLAKQAHEAKNVFFLPVICLQIPFGNGIDVSRLPVEMKGYYFHNLMYITTILYKKTEIIIYTPNKYSLIDLIQMVF